MRIVVQRVQEASVEIDSKMISKISKGLLVLLGIENEDENSDADYLIQKLINLRIFSDNEGKMNLSIKEIDGEVLIVSQFTLHASTKKGNRPSYIRAARPENAVPLYNYFIQKVQLEFEKTIQIGEFGADMQVRLLNDGPVTIIIDSKNKDY
jgi:D-tyrosyl-tRNA(Tyr) deacylase